MSQLDVTPWARIVEIIPLLIPVLLIEVALMVWALIDIAKRKHVRGNNKVVWILVVVLINIIGPIIYFFLGRQDGPPEEENPA